MSIPFLRPKKSIEINKMLKLRYAEIEIESMSSDDHEM